MRIFHTYNLTLSTILLNLRLYIEVYSVVPQSVPMTQVAQKERTNGKVFGAL
jgi:hypothetical protein